MQGDPYQILGVSPDATDKEIRTAFRTLAKALHPDRNPDDPAAEARFKEVAEAWEVLSDPVRRSEWRHRDRSRRDAPDADWLDTFDLIVDTIEAELKGTILPQWVARHGLGFDLMTALRGAVDEGVALTPLPVEVSPWIRWRTKRLIRTIHVVADDSGDRRGMGSVVEVRQGAGRQVVVISMVAFWVQGARSEEVLRDVLPRVLSAGLVAALARKLGAKGRTPPEVWAARPFWRHESFWPIVWSLAAALSVGMIWTALRQSSGH